MDAVSKESHKDTDRAVVVNVYSGWTQWTGEMSRADLDLGVQDRNLIVPFG